MVKFNLTKVDWNNEYNWEMDNLFDIINHYNKHGNLHIVLNGDGLDVQASGLKRVIKFLELNYPSEEIIIENTNLLNKNFIVPKFYKRCQIQNIIKKNISKTFCIFVGRPSWDRLLISSWVYHNAKNVIQTNHSSTYEYINFEGKGYSSNGVEFDTLCKRNIENINYTQILNYIQILPQVINKPSGQYTSNNPMILINEYKQCFLEIVIETAKEGNVFFPTEKIFRPIMFKTPFIVFGPVNFLKNLRKLGFKTFDGYWNEGYDDHVDSKYRIQVVIDELNYINNKPIDELNKMYNKMKPILEHNYNVLMNLTDEKFKEAFSER